MAAEQSVPKYVVNTVTRVIYAYSPDLLAMQEPKFIPFDGDKLPPIDFETGVRLAPKNTDEVITHKEEPLTDEQRIERIAAIVHMVPKEEISESGAPSVPAVERLSGLTGVRRAEVNRAVKFRAERVKGSKAEQIDNKETESADS